MSEPGRPARWMAFEPRDTVMVRDGRQFDLGADAAAESTLPGPSTVAGAVFAALGRREPAEVRGPVLAIRDELGRTPYFPAPLDLVAVDGDRGQVHRLQVDGIGAVTDLADAVPSWMVGDGDPVGGFVSGATLREYLGGVLVAPGAAVDRQRLDHLDSLFAVEPRVGLARTADRTARPGMLYQAGHLRPADGVALVAQYLPVPGTALPEPAGPVPLGGRGRLADVTTADGMDWPERPEVFPGGRVVVYVATPAIWPGGWLPPLPLPSGARLEAAAVGPAQPVATASPRGYAHNNGGETVDYANTRMLRWAVPAGSVYLVSFADAGEPPHAVDGGAAAGGPAQLAAGERAARWAASVHGTAIGRADCDQGARCRAHPDCRLRTAGFGVVLTGAWT